MKKMINWVLAATLICGASVLTSCTKNDDNPAPENAENRKEFIKHTRESLKEIAENLNFGSWEVANKINQEFNTSVLNNPAFEKAITPLFVQKIQESVKPVEEGSELAEMGYKQYATIDLTKFNYRFTMKEDGSGFDIKEADDFEMIINGVHPETGEPMIGSNKLTLKASGDTYKQFAKRFSNEDTGVVILIPSNFTFTLASLVSGSWVEGYKGTFTNSFELVSGSEFINLKNDVICIVGAIESAIPGSPDGKRAADASNISFASNSNPVNKVNTLKFSLGHNGRSVIDLDFTSDYSEKETNLNGFTPSGNILDVLVAMVTGSSLEGTITLNNDLTTALSVTDLGKAMLLQKEMAHDRRNYADQATIEEYTKQLNELVNAQITCKGVNQVIPMMFKTDKIGVDYWAMPALNFADEKGYVPMTQLLDKESVEYAINIVDHAAEPMVGAIVIVRQLLQFGHTFLMQMRVDQAQAQAANE